MMFFGKFNKKTTCKITFSKLNNTIQSKVFLKSPKVGISSTVSLKKFTLLLLGKVIIQICDSNTDPENERL